MDVSVKNISENDYLFSVALKVELNFVGKISVVLGSLVKR